MSPSSAMGVESVDGGHLGNIIITTP